jgi:hypothetical protein
MKKINIFSDSDYYEEVDVQFDTKNAISDSNTKKKIEHVDKIEDTSPI